MNNLIENGAETIQVFNRLWMSTKKDLPVRFSEMRLLLLLEKSREPIKPVAAAEILGIKKQMITTMVNVLEKKGYVTKSPFAEDKRSHTLLPTQKGSDLVQSRYTEYYKIVSTMKEKLGEDNFTAFIKLLGEINNILQDINITNLSFGEKI